MPHINISAVQKSVKYQFPLKVLILANLTLLGCQSVIKNNQSNIALEQFVSLKPIKDYLSTNLGSTGFGGKSYCAYEVFDAELDGRTEKVRAKIQSEPTGSRNNRVQKLQNEVKDEAGMR